MKGDPYLFDDKLIISKGSKLQNSTNWRLDGKFFVINTGADCMLILGVF
jgi:hypothetical protein